MSVARAKGAKARADRLWSEVVRLGQVCVSCASDQNLHAHHVISRRYNAVRHVLENGWPLCAACHRKVHEDPLLFVELIDRTIGRERYQELRALTRGTTAYREADWTRIAEDLKAKRDQIRQSLETGDYGHNGQTAQYPRSKNPRRTDEV